jgi:hypothetical protein
VSRGNALAAKAIALGGGEDVKQESVVPAGALDLAAGRAMVPVGAQEIEREATQPGEVFRGVFLAGARAVPSMTTSRTQ